MPKSSGNAISKTKARAMTRKNSSSATVSFRATSNGKPREVLLSHLMEQHVMSSSSSSSSMEEDTDVGPNGNNDLSSSTGMSFEDILARLGMNNRNTTWRNQWKALIEEQMIQPISNGTGPVFTSPFRLTTNGVEEASTDEYKESIAAIAIESSKSKKRINTNEGLHELIKSKLMNDRGDQILDLLLSTEKPLSRSDIAKKLGIAATGAYFSYALQQLKDLGYAENITGPNPETGRSTKLVRLTEKSFVQSRKEWYESKRSSSSSSSSSKIEKPKKEECVTQNDDVDDEEEADDRDKVKTEVKIES